MARTVSMVVCLLAVFLAAANARFLDQTGGFLRLPSASGEASTAGLDAILVANETELVSALTNETVSVIELTSSIVLTGELPVITRNLTISGNCSSTKQPLGAPCIISGNQTFRIFQVAPPKGQALSLVLRTLGLHNATAESGAAIHFVSGGTGTLEVLSSGFLGNQANGTAGGSAIHTDGHLTLVGSTFSANNGSGPAVYVANRNAVALQVNGSRFTANMGGALAARGLVQPASFNGNIWIANTNASGGAAIDLAGGKGAASLVEISGDLFVRNQGLQAGAVHLHGYRFVVTSARFFANVAQGPEASGGAIHAEKHEGASFVTSATVTANSAAVGAGIYGDGGSLGLCSCVLLANTASAPGAADNVLFEGQAIAIWPWGTVWGAGGAPIAYDYTQACGAPSALSLW